MLKFSGPNGPIGWGLKLKKDYFHQVRGLNLTLFRAYDSSLGRWLSRDPLAESGGVNLYQYAGNGPTNAVDTLGLSTVRIATNSGGQTLVDASPNQVRDAIAALPDGAITSIEIVGHGNQNFISMGKGATDDGITDIRPGKVVYTDTLMQGTDFAQQLLPKLAPGAHGLPHGTRKG